MMKALALPILALAGLSACASVVPPPPAPMAVSRGPGSELIGQQVRVETAGGQISTLHFAPNGAVRAQFGDQQVAGNWVANQTQLCFSWAGAARECWPYTAPLRRGQTVSLTSDRGNVVRVTLL